MKKIIPFIVFLFIIKTSSAQKPTVQASNIQFTGYTTTSLSFSWTRGNGSSCLVVVHPYSSATSYPIDGNVYSASTVYGNGTNLGNTNYVVSRTAISSMTVTGLASNTRYSVLIYEYNNIFGTFYLTPGAGNNHYTLDAAPTLQASALTASSISTAGATLSWTSGNGTYELVSLRQSTSNSNLPVDGTAYSSSTTFGSGDALGSASPYSYVSYISSGNSVAVIGCTPGTDYVANCVTYNGLSGAQNYYTTGYPSTGFTTLQAQPTGNCTYSYFTDVTENAMTVHWVRPVTGAGANVLVTMRNAAAADLPVDQNNYTANAAFGSGSAIGSSFVVYAGTGNTVRVTGLSANTLYYVAIVEYNGGVGTYNPTNNYASSYLTGNKYTLPAEPTTNASNLVFSNVQTNQVTATWTSGNGTDRIVAVRPSRIQTALAFDGTNDYVSVPYNSLLQPTTALTVEAWAYKPSWSSTTGWQTIAGNFSSKGYELFSYYNTIYSLIYANGTANYLSCDVSFLTPGWHHFAMTYDGAVQRVFVDGAEKATKDFGATTYPLEYTYSNSFIIGAEAGTAAVPSGNYFNGYIDEVRVWNIAQPVMTIRSNMNRSMLGNESGLVAAWSLNDGYAASTTAENSSLNTTVLQGTLTNFNATTAATAFTATSGWIKSGATVDLPLDYTYYTPSTLFNNGIQVVNKYYSVYWGTGTSVTVTGLSPGTYYDFVVAEDAYPSNHNYQTSTYLMGDVLTASQPLPAITSFSPSSGPVGSIVTITGTNFDPITVNNTVYFGATKAAVISATATQLVVLVPYCANYVPVSVEVNTMTALSRNPFVVTNSCSSAISGSSFTASTYTTGSARSAVAAKDIDGDGKSDLIYNDKNNNTFSVIRNQSSNGAVSWGTTTNFSTNSLPLHGLAATDLDGDNKPDVAVSCYLSGTSTLEIFRNTSVSGSVSFATKIQIPSGAYPTHIRTADLDNDGKMDLVVGHVSGGIVSVYRNTSSKGFISFDDRIDLPALGDDFSVDVADLNGDGKVDIIAGDRTNNNISVFQNTSTPGAISFGAVINIAAGSSPESVAAGDMDNDGKPDICAGLTNGTIRIYKNSNSGGAIISGNFTLQTTLTALGTGIYGLLINDLDGDTRNDLVCGYNSTSSISMFEQTGTFVFSPKVDFAGSGSYSYFLCADDFTLDGKTDIVSANYNTTLSVYNNGMNALAAEPVGAPSAVTISGISQTTVNITFTAGGGTNRIVVVKPSTAALVQPVDGVGYTANSVYGSGTDLGGGNYVVYNGNSNSVAVTGLLSNTTYNVYVYEYNGGTCTANYLLTPGSNSATTLNTPPTLNSISNPAAMCQTDGTKTIGLTGIGTGAPGETNQVITVTASSGNTTLIPSGSVTVTYTNPNTTGSLSYTPVSTKSGICVITVTVNDNASNNNIIQKTFTVTVNAIPTVANAGTNTSICASATSLAGNTPAVGTGLWSTVYTSNGAIAIATPTSSVSPISNFNIGDSVRLAWTISNAPCSNSVSYVSIKRMLCPLAADFIASQTNFCGTNASVTFSDLSSVPGPNSIVSWSWSFPGGSPSTYTTSVGTNPPAISYTAAGTYNVSLQVYDNLAGNDIETKTSYITITALPGTASAISGNTTVCQGEAGVAYSVSPISGASTYSWSVPSGATINTGQGTLNITVDFGTGASAGNISVAGQNSCGSGTAYNKAITVNTLPGATGIIFGPTSACQGENGVIFSVSPISGASTYTWTFPSGTSIVSGVNTNSVTLNFSASATDGTVDVVGYNGCGHGTSSSAYGLSIDSLPLPAGIISGNTTVCPGDTVVYSIASLDYASTYSWSLPAGASVVAGANTESIKVAYAVSAVPGTITVYGINACGNGTNASLFITVNPLPSAATAVLGNSTVCAGSSNESYFVSAITNATGYTWNLPSGFTINSGNNTNSILANISSTVSSGTISVNGTNACGSGTAATFTVMVNPLPDSAGTITGSSTVCQGQSSVTYTVSPIASATGYNWSVPTGASVISGSNTNTITVDYSSVADTGFVTVIGTNACGNGLSVDSFAVTVHPLPGAAGVISGNSAIIICPVQTGITYSVAPVSNATGYNWSVPTGAVIASGANTNTIVVNYSDTASSGNISVTPINACGNGTPFNLQVNVDTVPSQNICIVTVDQTSTKNFLIWEKPASTRIDSFFIYREIASAYSRIGSVAYNDVSEFTDNNASPNVTSYKYKLSSVDSCGNESLLSEFHRTIHLAVSLAIPPASFNLSWNDYIGFTVSQYRILRNKNHAGYLAVDSTSFGTTAWTDTTGFLPADTIAYVIEIDHPNGCVSSVKDPGPLATNLNSSRSNVYKISDSTLTSIETIDNNLSVSVYPNPGKGVFNVKQNSNFDSGRIQIYNILGEEVKSFVAKPNEKFISIDMRGFAKGVYHLKMSTPNKIVNKKFIIQ